MQVVSGGNGVAGPLGTSNAYGAISDERETTSGARETSQKLLIATDEEVTEVIDAITGATWNTRNSIMECLFFDSLEEHADEIPDYRPPGQA